MFKKLLVGTVATGIILSGAGNTFAAETSTLNNHSNNVVEKSIKSKQSSASVNVEIRSNGNVRFLAENLANRFENKYYDEIIFTIEDPGNRDYLKRIDREQEIISVTPGKSTLSGNQARITYGTKEELLDHLYNIHNNMGYDMPNDEIMIYAYAKPSNDSKYWPLKPFKLQVNDLY